MKKRFLCLLLGMLLLLSACKGKESDPGSLSDTVPESEPVTEPFVESEPTEETEQIALVKGGKAQFTIIYNADEDWSWRVAEELKKQLIDKTNLTFTVRAFEIEEDETSIFVGYSYNEVANPDTVAPYGTYGVVLKDGDLYICGDDADYAKKGVTMFVSSITLDMMTEDANGKTEVIIPITALSIKIPEVREMKLLGESLQRYRFVLSAQATETEKYMVQEFVKYICSAAGYTMEIVSDAEAVSEREIVVGNTARSESAAFYDGTQKVNDYAIVGNGTSVYLGYGSVLAMDEVSKRFLELCNAGTEGAIDISGSVEDTLSPQRMSESDIRVMSSNVLYYVWQEGEKTNYKQRMRMLVDTYAFYMPDFIGLQECEYDSQNAMTPYLPEEYEWVDFSKAEGFDRTMLEKIKFFPILYRTDLWNIEACGTGTFPHHNRPWGFVWVTFSHVDDPSRKFTLINGHFTYVPDINAPVLQDTQSPYGRPLIEEVNATIKSFLAKDPDIPIAGTGDYNNNCKSDVFNIVLLDGLTETMKLSWQMTDDVNFEEGRKGAIIDHILVSNTTLEAVRHREVSYFGLLFASDHRPQFADFRIKTNS